MTKVKVRFKRGGRSQVSKLQKAMRQADDLRKNLADVIAEINSFEQLHGLTTVEFYARYQAGLMGDSRDFIKWAGAFDDYQYLMKRASPQRITELRAQSKSHSTPVRMPPGQPTRKRSA